MSDKFVPARFAAPQWWVQVHGRAFGPYTIEQMARFLDEGRVRYTTLVSTHQDGGWTEAHRMSALRGLRPQRPSNDSQPEAANVFVHADIVSGARTPFMAAMEELGSMCALGAGLWLLRTRFSVGVIRNTLSQTLERSDRFVVMDVSRDRLAWFNLGPEIDARIATVWNAPLRQENA